MQKQRNAASTVSAVKNTSTPAPQHKYYRIMTIFLNSLIFSEFGGMMQTQGKEMAALFAGTASWSSLNFVHKTHRGVVDLTTPPVVDLTTHKNKSIRLSARSLR